MHPDHLQPLARWVLSGAISQGSSVLPGALSALAGAQNVADLPLLDPLLLGLPDGREVTDDEMETLRDTTRDVLTEGDAEFFVDNVCVRVTRAVTVAVTHPLKV